MSFWQENLQFLLGNAPYLYQQLVNGKDEEDIDAFWDYSKRMVHVQSKGYDIWLGSTIDSEAEAAKLFTDSDQNAGMVIVIGLGNIKLFGHLKKHFKSVRQIIVLEPSINIAREVLKNVSLKKIFSAFNDTSITLVFRDNPKEIDNLCQSFRANFPGDTVSIINTVYYSQLFPFFKSSTKKMKEDEKIASSIGLKTVTVFRYIWLVNSWRNLAISAPEVNDLESIFKELPVIIVSAGPSLNKNIHLLKEVGNRAIIIAVGSAIKILDSNGIVPHLRLAIDGSVLEKKLFEGIEPSECPLIYTPMMYYETVDFYRENAICMLLYKNSSLHEYVYRTLERRYQTVSSGGSVANVAIFLAATLNCKKIIVMGQDFSFTNNKMHASGTWASESLNDGIINTRNKMLVKNVFGEEVVTDDVYWSMKKTMEDSAQWYPHIEFINATEGGLPLKGFENKRLAIILSEDLRETSIDIRKFTKELMEPFTPTNKQLYQKNVKEVVGKIRAQMQVMKKEVHKLENLAKKDNGGKSLVKVKKQYEKIRDDSFYKNYFFNAFAKEELEVNKKFSSNNLEEKIKALEDYIDIINEYINFSDELAEEFVVGKEKMNLVFEL